jgi:hypothetical protein
LRDGEEITMATEHAEVSFVVKEHVSGKPWIMIEWISGPDVLKGTWGFDLVDGTTLGQAKEVAGYMREHIRKISVTR